MAMFEAVVFEDPFVIARPFINTTPGQTSTVVPFVSQPIIPVDSIVSGSFIFSTESDVIVNSTGSGVI